jgi:hypothetical protein
LKRLGYRAGQPIAGDALSEATLVALANLLGTPPDSALMRELRDGTRAIALDVVVAPRLRDGSPVVFSDIKNIPTLSRLEPNATAVGRARRPASATVEAEPATTGAERYAAKPPR